MHVEVVRTDAGGEIGARLLAQFDAVTAAIARFAPDVVAVERVFSQHNVRTVMGTAQVAGLALVAATRAGIPVALHTPSEVKAAVTGSGRADKAQVGAMVTRLLRLDAGCPVRPTPPTRSPWPSATCGGGRRRPASQSAVAKIGPR